MATYGIEAIRHFENARTAGVSTAGDLTYTFNRSNVFDNELRSHGHTRAFYWAETNCWETDIRYSDQGGDDRHWVDNVDIFWIETHGNHEADGQARMLYDTPQNNWRTFSHQWQLGENWNAEWIMAYSCETVDLNNVTGLWNMFAGMHIYCGAWGLMWDGITTDECGEDVAANLTSGHTVADAWIDGVSDWAVDNHPITVCAGNAATWNGGNIRWDLSYLNRDHLSEWLRFGFLSLSKRKAQRLLAPTYIAAIRIEGQQEAQAYMFAVPATEVAYLSLPLFGHEAPPSRQRPAVAVPVVVKEETAA